MTPSNLPPNGGVKEIFTLTQGQSALTAKVFCELFDLSLKIHNTLLKELYGIKHH